MAASACLHQKHGPAAGLNPGSPCQTGGLLSAPFTRTLHPWYKAELGTPRKGSPPCAQGAWGQAQVDTLAFLFAHRTSRESSARWGWVGGPLHALRRPAPRQRRDLCACAWRWPVATSGRQCGALG